MKGPRWKALLAFILLVIFALIGGWTAMYSESQSIQGGLPFFSKETNAIIGRAVFGGGALISFIMAIFALKDYLKKN